MKESKHLLRNLFLLLFLLVPNMIFAQVYNVKGNVKDGHGEPVLGAYILEKGTNNGVASDMDGNFTIQVKKGATLTVSFIGLTTQEVVVNSADQ